MAKKFERYKYRIRQIRQTAFVAEYRIGGWLLGQWFDTNRYSGPTIFRTEEEATRSCREHAGMRAKWYLSDMDDQKYRRTVILGRLP